MDLKSSFHDVADADEWLELAYRKRWTDGLVAAPPTERATRWDWKDGASRR